MRTILSLKMSATMITYKKENYIFRHNIQSKTFMEGTQQRIKEKSI